MSPRQILLSLAALFVVAGIFLGMRSITAEENDCGSVFSPSTSEAEMQDSAEEIAGTLEGATPDTDGSNVAACDSAISDAKPLAYGGIGLGVLGLFAALVASGNKPTNPDGSAKPSVWR